MKNTDDKKDAKDSGKVKASRRPPTRRLIRHVLRARTEAARQLGAFLKRIDRPGVRVSASEHMVDIFGGGYESLHTQDPSEVEGFPTGWRDGKEVMKYLKSKGARFERLYLEEDEQGYEWAALQSDTELSPLESPGSGSGSASGNESKAEDMDWVAPKRR